MKLKTEKEYLIIILVVLAIGFLYFFLREKLRNKKTESGFKTYGGVAFGDEGYKGVASGVIGPVIKNGDTVYTKPNTITTFFVSQNVTTKVLYGPKYWLINKGLVVYSSVIDANGHRYYQVFLPNVPNYGYTLVFVSASDVDAKIKTPAESGYVSKTPPTTAQLKAAGVTNSRTAHRYLQQYYGNEQGITISFGGCGGQQTEYGYVNCKAMFHIFGVYVCTCPSDAKGMLANLPI